LFTCRSTGFPKASFPSSWKETLSIEIFSTLPSYSRSPSRRKYVRACGFETTAIIPFGERTMPSRRSVLTCRPSLPGGRFGPPALFCLPIKDSNGSRRACLISLAAAAGAEPGVEAFSTVLRAGLAALALPGCFAPDLAPVLAAGLLAGLAACAAGFATGVAGFVWAGVAGLAA